MSRSFFAVLGVLAVVAGTTAATPASADATAAEEPFSACSAGWFCTWDSEQGIGQKRMNFQEGARDLAENNYNDMISSVYNRSNQVFCLYEHSYGDGRHLAISVGYKARIPDRYNFRDITSSIGAANSTGHCDGDVPGAD